MKLRKALSFLMVIVFAMGFTLAGFAEEESQPVAEQKVEKEKSRAEKASEVLTKQMEQPEGKRISSELLGNAKCIGVFPSVVKAGFLVAAKRGNGLLSCRHEETGEWGSPAFFKLTGASVGFQVGVQSASVIMLFMDQNSVDTLVSGKMSMGGAGVSVAAGPVGGGIGSDDVKSSIITYGKSKGIFAGIDLEGSSLTYGKDSNDQAYGKELSALDLLLKTDEVPESLLVFRETLTKYAPTIGPQDADVPVIPEEEKQDMEENNSKAEDGETQEEKQPAAEEAIEEDTQQQ
jgi:lipid-binding SYLF domain-containing protein